MNEILNKIRLWKRKSYEYISCIPYGWGLVETWNVYVLCTSYEWNVKKSMIMKRDNLMSTSYKWCFVYSANGMLRSCDCEKERSICLALGTRLCA